MAARTLAQLQQAVQDLGYGTDSLTAQTGFLNSEYRIVAGERRWEWLQGTFLGELTIPGTVVYTLPLTDMRNLDAVWVTDGQDNQFAITYIEPLKLLDLSQDRTAFNLGAPRHWSFWNGQLWLYPTPDAVYSLTIAYTKNVTPLVAPGDTPWIPEAYDDALVWGSVARLAYRLRDWLGREFAQTEVTRVMNEMRSEYNLKQRQTADEVEATGIWNQGQNRPIVWG